MAQVTPTPTAIPPRATHKKVSPALASENVPVSVAAMANRRQTSPDASLSSDSPSRMCIIRAGIGTRAPIADTAIGSVGDTTAASANATGSGMAGIIQWMNRPTPRTVKTTRPSARPRIVRRSSRSASLGMRHPSRKSSGGRNSRKKRSGASVTRRCAARPIAAPRAICTSGRGIATGSIRDTRPLTTTASTRTRPIVTVSTAALRSRRAPSRSPPPAARSRRAGRGSPRATGRRWRAAPRRGGTA